MKLSKLIAPLLGLCVTATCLRASEVPLFITTFSLKVSLQNTTTTNGSVATTPPPISKNYTLANLLTRLGQDVGTNLTGGRLAVISSNDNTGFFVMDSTGTNILADVSSILSAGDGDFHNEIVSGTQNIDTGLASPKSTKSHAFWIYFNDTDAGNLNGPLEFYLRGIMTESKSDTSPSGGVYTETHTVKMVNGFGEGHTPDGDFLCTGSISGSGRGTVVLPL